MSGMTRLQLEERGKWEGNNVSQTIPEENVGKKQAKGGRTVIPAQVALLTAKVARQAPSPPPANVPPTITRFSRRRSRVARTGRLEDGQTSVSGSGELGLVTESVNNHGKSFTRQRKPY